MIHTFIRTTTVLRRVTIAVAAAASWLVAAAACSPGAGPIPEATGTPAESRTAQAAPATEPPIAALPDGTQITLELAITPDELAQGLMFRPQLPEDRGMLLIFSEERQPSIWMMNTLVALDLVYLDSNGLIVDVIPDAQPCPGEPCPRFVPKQPARAVLEIPAGTAVRHGLIPGQRLEFARVPGYPTADES